MNKAAATRMMFCRGDPCDRPLIEIRSLRALTFGLVFVLMSSSLAILSFQTTNLTIKYHNPKDKSQLKTVVLAWQEAQIKLRAIGLEPRAVSLEAHGSASEFSKATSEPWFVAAVTRENRIQTQRFGALKTRGILRFTILHEAFHTVQPAKLPRWLAEGLARIFSGENSSDPNQTKLEHLTEAQLSTTLEGRSAQINLNQAYWEASRRARALLMTRGWKGVLSLYR